MPERPLRIALLTHSVNPRGGVVHTLELAQALHAAGHAVTVFAPGAPGQRFFRELPCASVVVPVGPTAPGMVAMVRARIDAFTAHLRPRLADEAFDVLHTHDSIGGNALAELQDEGRIGAWTRTVHHLDHFDEPQLMRWQQAAFERAGQLLCVSRLWRDHLREVHGRVAHEVGNGVDTTRFTPLRQAGDTALAARLGLGTALGGPVVLALGGIEERKNTLRLLTAFAALRETHPGAQLVLAGGASLLDHSAFAQAFEAERCRLGLDEGPHRPLRITGALADADVPALYRLADVVAMPSLREGFGLVVLEALASGVPVVVSRIAPFVDYLEDGDANWANPMCPNSIADALRQALAARDAARIAATSARLAARFSWHASAARHLQLYRAALEEPVPCP